jgi:hypothetical protein
MSRWFAISQGSLVRSGALVAAALVAGSLVAGSLMAASPATASTPTAPVLTPSPFAPTARGASPSRCADVLLIGFRGSGEHPRGLNRHTTTHHAPLPWTVTDFTHPDFARQRRTVGVTAAEDRLGTTLGSLYEALALHHRAQGRSVGFWSVGVDEGAAFGYGELYGAPPVDAVNLDRYLTSISTDSLTREVMPAVEALAFGTGAAAPWCPNTHIVVAGFSQGAVLARALVTNLHQQLRRRGLPNTALRDLILIGDPLFRRQEHRLHGVVHDSDHQVDGLLRIDLVALCDRNRVMRALCATTASGSGSVRSWFRDVWRSLRLFAEQHPELLRGSLGQLAQRGTQVTVVCDSGDVVCSPIRIVSTLRWDSDFPELLTGRPDRTIHGSYHRTVPWDQVVAKLSAPGKAARL